MARPKLEIDPKQVEELAAIDCSYEEMAAVLDCSVSLLHKRFSTVIKTGRERGKHSLKRAQYTMAIGGNATMLIWLGKQRLGQTDKVVQQVQATDLTVSIKRSEVAPES